MIVTHALFRVVAKADVAARGMMRRMDAAELRARARQEADEPGDGRA